MKTATLTLKQKDFKPIIEKNMKLRTPPFVITPVHRSGYTAPGIYVSCDTYAQALKIAASMCILVRKYPNEWALI